MNYYVYAHRKLDGTIFYIGMGKNSRAWVRSDRSLHWTNTTRKYKYRVEIILSGLQKWYAWELESSLIDYYGRKDLGYGTLVNKVDGGPSRLDTRSSEEMSKHGHIGGIRGVQTQKEKGIGLYGPTTEDRKRHGKDKLRLKIGFNGYCKEDRSHVGKSCVERKTGIFGYTSEQLSEQGKVGGKIGGHMACKITNSQISICLQCKFTSTAAGIATHQKHKGHKGEAKVS